MSSLELQRLKEFMAPVLRIAKYAMVSPSEDQGSLYDDASDDDHKPLMEHVKKFMNPSFLKRFDEETHEIPANLFERSTSVGSQNWMQEFESMGLPLFLVQYVQLVHVPLDVMHECLRLQAELGRELRDPSPHSVRQVRDSQAAVAVIIHAIKYALVQYSGVSRHN